MEWVVGHRVDRGQVNTECLLFRGLEVVQRQKKSVQKGVPISGLSAARQKMEVDEMREVLENHDSGLEHIIGRGSGNETVLRQLGT